MARVRAFCAASVAGRDVKVAVLKDEGKTPSGPIDRDPPGGTTARAPQHARSPQRVRRPRPKAQRQAQARHTGRHKRGAFLLEMWPVGIHEMKVLVKPSDLLVKESA